MKLRVLEKVFDFDHDRHTGEDVIAAIKRELEDTRYIYNYIIVDGVDVYEGPHDFMKNNPISEIREIVVVVQTANELLHGIFTSSVDYLDRAVPHIETLSKDFYQGATGQTWSALAQLIEGLQWILSSYSMVNENQALSQMLEAEEWHKYAQIIKGLQEIVAELMGAVESQDQVLVADLLAYEIAPHFQDLLVVLEQMMSRGGNSIAH